MDAQVILTVRRGPVVHVWHNGQEVARVALDFHAALSLVRDLLKWISPATAGLAETEELARVETAEPALFPSRAGSADLGPGDG